MSATDGETSSSQHTGDFEALDIRNAKFLCRSAGKDRRLCNSRTQSLADLGAYQVLKDQTSFSLHSFNCQEVKLSKKPTRAHKVSLRLNEDEEHLANPNYTVFDLGPVSSNGFRRWDQGEKKSVRYGVTNRGYGIWFVQQDRGVEDEQIDFPSEGAATVSLGPCADGDHEWVCDVSTPKALVKKTDDPQEWYLFIRGSGINPGLPTDTLSPTDFVLQGTAQLGKTLTTEARPHGNGYQGELRLDSLHDTQESTPGPPTRVEGKYWDPIRMG